MGKNRAQKPCQGARRARRRAKGTDKTAEKAEPGTAQHLFQEEQGPPESEVKFLRRMLSMLLERVSYKQVVRMGILKGKQEKKYTTKLKTEGMAEQPCEESFCEDLEEEEMEEDGVLSPAEGSQKS